jgi:hypothetical protein
MTRDGFYRCASFHLEYSYLYSVLTFEESQYSVLVLSTHFWVLLRVLLSTQYSIATLMLDHKSGLEPDHTLPPPGESFHTPRSPELHRIAEPSGPPPSKPQGKSTSGGSVAARSKLRSTRFLVKREDGKSFKVSHTKLKPALPDIEAGKAASVITKSGTWVIRIVAS